MSEDVPAAAFAKWTITVDLEFDDGYKRAAVKVSVSNDWKDSGDVRPFSECLALELGSVLRAIEATGHTFADGDPLSGFADAMEGREVVN